MIAGADTRARNAFLATLRENPSAPLLPSCADSTDVLEVRDLPRAIQRAEQVIRDRASRPGSQPDDIFDTLAKRATDDTSGPHLPYTRPTPIPAPLALFAASAAAALPPPFPLSLSQAPSHHAPLLAPIVERTLPMPAAPNAPWHVHVPHVPHAAPFVPSAARTAPILVLDEDAFYHPAGRIRGFADVTIEPDAHYVPESTLMMRFRQRKNLLSWVVAGVLAPLTLLVLFGVAMNIGRARAARSAAEPQAQSTILAKPAPTSVSQPTVVIPPKAAPTPAPTPTPVLTTKHSNVPIADVKSLKSAPAKRR